MRKLIRGIVEFRKKRQPGYKDIFAKLALGQRPDTLFVACSDSRVQPNLFASAEPGDMFVIRNVGNLISPCDEADKSLMTDVSEAAAIEYAIEALNVRDVIICGHSECGAMCAMVDPTQRPPNTPHLVQWLRHAQPSLDRMSAGEEMGQDLPAHNQLSQINVLQQIEHLKTYPNVQKRIAEGTLDIHAWWFNIKEAEVYAYDQRDHKFRLVEEKYADVLLRRYSPNPLEDRDVKIPMRAPIRAPAQKKTPTEQLTV